MSNKKNQKMKILIGATVVILIGVIIFLGYWKTKNSEPYGSFYVEPIAKKDRGSYATVNFDREGLQEGNVAEIRHNQWTAAFQGNSDIMHSGTDSIAYTDIIFRDKNGNIDNGPFDGDEIPVARICFDIPVSIWLKNMSVDIVYKGNKYSFDCIYRNANNENASIVGGQNTMYMVRTSIELGRNNEGFWKPIYEEFVANGPDEMFGDMTVHADYSPSMYTYSTTIDSSYCFIADIAKIVDDICTLSGDKSYNSLLQTEGTPYVFEAEPYTEGDWVLRSLEDGTKEVMRFLNKEASEAVIPQDVTIIGKGAFEDCTSLTNITIPNSVISIWWGAFKNCSSLTSITIPESVTSIGVGVFNGCTSLTSFVVTPGSYAEQFAKEHHRHYSYAEDNQ